jgi:L-fuculose-phosphate aldolase
MSDLDRLKQEICDIGDRLYKRGFAAANDRNNTYRVSENEVLCTPAMHCKGFIKPAEIALIDMEGRQLAGEMPRSSEAVLHVEIMMARPDVKSVVHCHPPHATAFAVAHVAFPNCVLP